MATDPKIQRSTVHRPNESGVDLPAGRSADELRPTDYQAIEIDADADRRDEENPPTAETGRS